MCQGDEDDEALDKLQKLVCAKKLWVGRSWRLLSSAPAYRRRFLPASGGRQHRLLYWVKTGQNVWLPAVPSNSAGQPTPRPENEFYL